MLKINPLPTLFNKRLPHIKLSPYPKGKSFAFTIVDDTDGSTLESIRPIYDCLADFGFKTTKTIWMHKSKKNISDPRHQGDTAERKDYVDYLMHLKNSGFEICLHNVSSSSSTREEILSGFEKFKKIFGQYPKINVHHEKNLENLYFGIAQNFNIGPSPFYGNFFRKLYKIFKGIKSHLPGCNFKEEEFKSLMGEKEGSPYFWGDICKEKIKYVRTNIFFEDLNTLKCNPNIPYQMPETPFVNYWFDSSNGQDVKTFNKILTQKNINRLEREKGCCILYTHFGKGFTDRVDGKYKLNSETRQQLSYLAGKDDLWLVPVSEILDRLLAIQKLYFYPLSNGIVLLNDGSKEILGITLWTSPFKKYYGMHGKAYHADDKGRVIIPSIESHGSIILLESIPASNDCYWYDRGVPYFLLDLKKVFQKITKKFVSH